MPRRRTYNPTHASSLKYFDNTPRYFESAITLLIPRTLAPPATNLSQLIFVPVTTKVQCESFISQYESFILNIIQQIIDRVSLDSILEPLQAMQTEITSRVQAEQVIVTIERLILSILDNITNRVSLDVVLERVDYLKTKLAEAPCIPAVYGEVGDLLLYAIDLIMNREDLDMVLSGLVSMQTNLTTFVDVADDRSEEHTSELQSHHDLVCRLLPEKKKPAVPYSERAHRSIPDTN